MAVSTYKNIQGHNLENYDLNYVKVVKNTSVHYPENLSQQIHIQICTLNTSYGMTYNQTEYFNSH
jgi:hypothetical protein